MSGQINSPDINITNHLFIITVDANPEELELTIVLWDFPLVTGIYQTSANQSERETISFLFALGRYNLF